MIHEDERRKLFDIDQSSETVKVILTKEDCLLGGHFHKEKTETFALITGECTINLDGNVEAMEFGKKYIVTPNVRHEFILKKDSVLICLVDRKYNPNDDFK